MATRLIKIGDAAVMLGTNPGTLRKWESTGELLPARKTRGGTRYYDVDQLLDTIRGHGQTVGYVRVSGRARRAELDRRQAALEKHAADKGWNIAVIRDSALGVKPGMRELAKRLMRGECQRLALLRKEDLPRAAADAVLTLCATRDIEVVIVNQDAAAATPGEPAKGAPKTVVALYSRLRAATEDAAPLTADEIDRHAASLSRLK